MEGQCRSCGDLIQFTEDQIVCRTRISSTVVVNGRAHEVVNAHKKDQEDTSCPQN